jgi:hypothetical protein
VIAVVVFAVRRPGVRKVVATAVAGTALAAAGPGAAATSSEVLAPAVTVTVSSGGPAEPGRVAVGRGPTGDVLRALLHVETPGLDPSALESATLVLTEPACGAGG